MITDINAIQQNLQNIGCKKDNATFFTGFLAAFGFPTSTIERLKLTSNYNVNVGVYVGQQIFFLSSEGSNLYSELNILKKNNIKNIKAKFVIIANLDEIIAFDIRTGDTIFSSKKNLYTCVDFFFPLIGKERPAIGKRVAVNIKVGEKFAHFYNECRLYNSHISLESINEFICRILFFCVIDSIGLLFKDDESLFSFSKKYSNESGSDFFRLFDHITKAVRNDDRRNLPIYFSKINHIDSRIFANPICEVSFSKDMRNIVLDIMSFDWTNVDPEILGALIQSIIVPNESNITGNFTATTNIQKLIRPLFLNDLYAEFENCQKNYTSCMALIKRILKISLFDTSCGCGNFLLVAYKELNILLTKIATAIKLDYVPLMPINNFYGIEINSFSCAIARMGLFFVVLQSKKCTLSSLQSDIEIFFNNNIVNDNPTRIPWDSVCHGTSETYIIGNPSYKGARRRSASQNADMAFVFKGYSKYKNLDYAACWFLLATKYIHAHGGSFAFVTTNSLTQGEQVSLLWPKLFAHNVYISFAHTAFKWRNNARNTTAVTVVIIGVSNNNGVCKCELYTQTTVTEPPQISPYLLPGTIFVERRSTPLSNLPSMVKGNMPYGTKFLLMDSETKNRAIEAEPRVALYIKKIVGSEEFIQCKDRWCLWIPTDKVNDALQIPFIKDRVEKNRIFRMNNRDPSARRLAYRPHQFREMRETKSYSLVVPSVSSENREYVPIGFVDSSTIVSNLAFVVYDCEPWIFGVVSSHMHNLWFKAVCGGLETRIRYSNELGYNTFPFPQISDEQKKAIRNCVNQVIAAREEDFDKTYAEMYRKGNMSSELQFAHHLLDLQIEQCYRKEPFINDDERLNCLFELYVKMGG